MTTNIESRVADGEAVPYRGNPLPNVLEDLVIHKGFQGKGYGSKLLDYAIDFAKQKNFRRITLLTDRPELRSQSFFRKHGFYESPMLPMRLLLTVQGEERDATL